MAHGDPFSRDVHELLHRMRFSNWGLSLRLNAKDSSAFVTVESKPHMGLIQTLWEDHRLSIEKCQQAGTAPPEESMQELFRLGVELDDHAAYRWVDYLRNLWRAHFCRLDFEVSPPHKAGHDLAIKRMPAQPGSFKIEGWAS